MLHGSLEGREIDLIKGAIAEGDIDHMPSVFLVIERKMLDAGSDPILLHPLYIRHYHRGRQAGIFSHILEVTSVERGAIDIDAGTEQNVFAAIEGFFSDALAVQQGHVCIPRSGKTGERRERHTTVIGPTGLIPLIPFHFRAYAVRAVGAPQSGNTESRYPGRRELTLGMQQSDFLVERHAPEGIFHTLLHRSVGIQIDLRCKRSCCQKGSKSDKQDTFHN